jgi:hypothetical protein
MGDVLGGEVLVYESPDGGVRVDVRLEQETVWLSLNQMAELFGRDKSVISRHLRNVFQSGELAPAATIAKNATVQREGGREVTREIEYYNLDAILSVGYRVNSKRGTQFRIWATRTLRDHLLRGYTLHDRRLAERGLGEIEQAVGLLARTLTSHALVTSEGQAVLDVVRRYTRAWRLLLQYDEKRLPDRPAHPTPPAAALSVAAGPASTQPPVRSGRCRPRVRRVGRCRSVPHPATAGRRATERSAAPPRSRFHRMQPKRVRASSHLVPGLSRFRSGSQPPKASIGSLPPWAPVRA